MEAVVWSDPQVLARLQNDFVIAALYVDDKTELPEKQWFTSTYDNKVKKTIGKQNADLQIANLNPMSEPNERSGHVTPSIESLHTSLMLGLNSMGAPR